MKNLSIFSLRRKLIFHGVLSKRMESTCIYICITHYVRCPRFLSRGPLLLSSLTITTLFRVDLSLVRPVGRALRGRDASRWNRFRVLSQVWMSPPINFTRSRTFADERPIIAARRPSDKREISLRPNQARLNIHLCYLPVTLLRGLQENSMRKY